MAKRHPRGRFSCEGDPKMTTAMSSLVPRRLSLDENVRGDHKLKERGKTLEIIGSLKSKLTFLRDVQQLEVDFLEYSVVVLPTFLGE